MLKHLDLVDHIVTFTFMRRTENKLRSNFVLMSFSQSNIHNKWFSFILFSSGAFVVAGAQLQCSWKMFLFCFFVFF